MDHSELLLDWCIESSTSFQGRARCRRPDGSDVSAHWSTARFGLRENPDDGSKAGSLYPELLKVKTAVLADDEPESSIIIFDFPVQPPQTLRFSSLIPQVLSAVEMRVLTPIEWLALQK